MQKIILLVLFLVAVSAASGEVTTTVYRADGNTPLEPIEVNLPIIKYPDIMAGTKLTIIVWSDVNEPWGFDGGALAIEERYWDYGVLSARDYNESTYDYEGSHFPAAGNEAAVCECEEPGPPPIKGFYLYGGSTGVEAGDWFIIDYNSMSIGDCEVRFYDYNINDEPVHYLSFSHVRTRDFNGDTKVNMSDFPVLASYWQAIDCNAPDWCEGTDLNLSGNVDLNDLRLFAEFWLERTE